MSYHDSRGKEYMSILESIDTSQYTAALSSTFLETTSAIKEITVAENEKLPNVAATEETTPEVDLSNYYSNVVSPENNPEANQGLAHASQELDNAVSAAIQHGMSAQDAINIQTAKVAYKANVEAMQSNTFELAV